MKSKLFLFIVSISCCTMLSAQTASMSLVVEMTDGTSSAFLLSEKPEMTFDGSDLVFKSNKAEIIVARNDFSHFHFTSIGDGVELPSGGAEVEFVAPSILRVRGVNVNAVVVYTLDGSLCNAEKTVEGDAVTISLRSLQQGVYVVRYGATAVKMFNN
ncbi:MAG: hypothetical protein HUK00_04055 [Bacteroidaceae bacterium]|nr:hypothetical protein [Bacteroidaceae bacterium]